MAKILYAVLAPLISASAAATPLAALENPQPGSFQSGIGLLSGWSCASGTIVVRVDGHDTNAPYGSSRQDVASVCGATNTNTGFGILVNYNLYGAGTHSAQLFVNGVASGSPVLFTVTVPSGEFMTGLSRQAMAQDFPSTGRTTTLIWQESQQNFAIQSVAATSGSYNQTVLADGPVAFWDVNKTATEPDLTGRGHTGIYKNGQPALVSLPNGDQAADFIGSPQYLTVTSASDLSIPATHQLTWEGWIRPDTLQFAKSPSGYVDWMGKCQNYSPTCEWEARMYNQTNPQNRVSRLSAYAFNPGAGLGSSADWQPNGEIFTSKQWIYVVAEYQTLTTPSGCDPTYPGTIDIWVNGVKWNKSFHGTTGCMSQYGIVPVANDSPVNIGTLAFDSYFQGAVGKVAIYDKLLTEAQIRSHWTTMTGLPVAGSCQASCVLGP